MHKPRRTRGASSLIQPIQGGRYACRREEQNQRHSMEEARLPILSKSFGRRHGHARGLVKAKRVLLVIWAQPAVAALAPGRFWHERDMSALPTNVRSRSLGANFVGKRITVQDDA